MWKETSKVGEGEGLFADFILKTNGKSLQEVKFYEKELKRGLEIVLRKRNRILIAAHRTEHLAEPEDYGPHIVFDQIGYPRAGVFTFNPNPYHRNRSWEDPWHDGEENPERDESHPPMLRKNMGIRPKKEKKFNFASLVQSATRKWLTQQSGVVKSEPRGGLKTTAGQVPRYIGTWPVELYGSRSGAQKRLTEDEMVKVLTYDWGCLMPKYEHAGSGWWRARPLQCADAGGILIGDDKELAVLYGWDYPFYGLRALEVSKMSDEELVEVAAVQKELLYRNHPLDRCMQQQELTAVLKASQQRGR